MLYLVATPIGHLDDMSKRALAALENCSRILCEDTRRSSILLNHYAISKKTLIPYHKFSEKSRLKEILDHLQAGENIALISDAGTPCINDPGLILVQACIEKNIPFTIIPGACSPILALILSGMDTTQFQYIGFLPTNATTSLRKSLNYPGTTIALESPSRLIDTLKIIDSLDPERQIAVAREMTKTFEECVRGNAKTLLAHFSNKNPRGEIILVIAGGKMPEEDTPIEEILILLQELHGLSLKEAIKTAAALKKTPKRLIYNKIHNNRPLS